MVDFYDSMMKRLDPTSKAWSYISPSIVYHYRYEHEYPEFKRGGNRPGRNSYLKEKLKHLHNTSDHTYWAQIYNLRYSWLSNKPSVRQTFRYRQEAVEYLKIQNNGKGFGTNSLGVNSKEQVTEQMWWRGGLAGWSVVWTPIG